VPMLVGFHTVDEVIGQSGLLGIGSNLPRLGIDAIQPPGRTHPNMMGGVFGNGKYSFIGKRIIVIGLVATDAVEALVASDPDGTRRIDKAGSRPHKPLAVDVTGVNTVIVYIERVNTARPCVDPKRIGRSGR